MITPKRLSSLADVTGVALRPTYEPARHRHGIVHLGIGAFHRAHQADYTDAALAAAGGDWRIVGASLRSVELADALNPQNGLYTLIERDASNLRARLIGSIERVIAASRAPEDLMTSLTDRRTRIVAMTVTEKAYGIARSTMTVDVRHPAIAADLRKPTYRFSVLGLLTEALRRRRIAQVQPFTVLCCDNLPDNGEFVRHGVVDFARRGIVRLDRRERFVPVLHGRPHYPGVHRADARGCAAPDELYRPGTGRDRIVHAMGH